MNTSAPVSSRMIAAAVLAVGICVIATSSILIRYVQALLIPSLSIAAIRLGISAVVLSGLVAVRWHLTPAGYTWSHVRLAMLSGVCLAIHFAAWIHSLEYTTVASSAALVATTPLWVGIAAMLIYKERLNRWRITGMALTVVGSIGIALGDQQHSLASHPLLGNSLALIGAISGSVYFLIGRGVRHHIPLLHYIWMSYGSAAITLCVASLAFGFSVLPTDPNAWLFLGALALGPQLIGHTSINYAMRHLSALLVTIAMLGEPVGSAILAFVFFAERIETMQLVGLFGLLVGIAITAYGETREEHTS